MQLVQSDPNFQLVQGRPLLPTRREVAARVFRQRTVFLVAFLLVVLGFVVSGQFTPKYRSEMKILVRKERVDPIVTTDQDSIPQLQTLTVREEDINSEVSLLRSDDLMRQVAIKSGLIADGDNSRAAAKIVRKLESDIDISALTKTDLISATYDSPSAEQSRTVLANLAALYLARQREVGSRDSQIPFFETQVKQHLTALQAAEARLIDFTQRTGVVSATLERDLSVHRMGDLDSARIENKSLIADAEGRERQIVAQLATQPQRIATEKREADNPQLLTQLKGELLTLQLKRTDLLNKYDPQYRLVKDVDREIATTQAQLDAQLNAPVRDDTTTINPTWLALENDLVKVRAELTGLHAKAAALAASSTTAQTTAEGLAGKDVEQDALLRDVATEKQQYQLYVGKLEQARVTEDLDKNGILNVVVAQDPGLATLPVNSAFIVTLAAIFAGIVLSFGAAFLADLFDPTVRNAEELIDVLHVPTLAEFGPMNQLGRGTL